MAIEKNEKPAESSVEAAKPARLHELEVFLQQDLDEIASEYARIFSRTTEDPGTAGDEGEENWAQLLRQWLPASYTVVTKGRILGTDGQATRQIDLVVLKPSYPTRLINKKMYLVTGVAAAFECKTTLKRAHLTQAASTARDLRQLTTPRTGSPYREVSGLPLYGVLAHSHVWKLPTSTPLGNVDEALFEEALKASHPRELLDLVCVADLCHWSRTTITYKGRATMGDRWTEMRPRYGVGEDGGPVTSFMGQTSGMPDSQSNPIAVMIAQLLQMLAWEDVTVRPMADYFRLAGLSGTSMGVQQHWPVEDVYSPSVTARLMSGESAEPFEWSEWQRNLP